MSEGENHLLVWCVRSKDGNRRDNMGCRVHMVLRAGAVTQARPGSGLGLSGCNRWHGPEGWHPMVLICGGFRSALKPSVLWDVMWTFHLRQPITSEKLGMTQSIQLAVNERKYCCRQWEAGIDLFSYTKHNFPFQVCLHIFSVCHNVPTCMAISTLKSIRECFSVVPAAFWNMYEILHLISLPEGSSFSKG